MSTNGTAPVTAERDPVSAFIVCMNEAMHIRACVESLSFCDEILVVDSFSTDRTADICRELGVTVIQRQWPGYKEQKAFGLRTVLHEWVINLDADERVSPELRDAVLKVLERSHEARASGSAEFDGLAGYMANRVVYHLGRWWRKGGWYPEYRLRFMRRSMVEWGGKDPHEKAIAHGRTPRIAGEILHYTYEDLDEQFGRLHKLSSLSADEDFRLDRRTGLFTMLFNPLLRSLKFYFLKGGYKEGKAGIIVAVAEGFYTFMKYAKLWDRHVRADIAKLEEANPKVPAGNS